MKIDQKTGDTIRLALQRAHDRGSDAVRALDELGLLWYPDKQRLCQADTLAQAADLLEQLQVNQLGAARQPLTPLDTKRAVADWLSRQAQEVRP